MFAAMCYARVSAESHRYAPQRHFLLHCGAKPQNYDFVLACFSLSCNSSSISLGYVAFHMESEKHAVSSPPLKLPDHNYLVSLRVMRAIACSVNDPLKALTDGPRDLHFQPIVHLRITHDIGLLYLNELHVLTRSVHYISHNSTVLVFTATAFRLARRDCFVMPFNIYGLYVPRECWNNNNIDMAEDDRDHGKRHESEAGPDLRSFLKYKSCNSSHCKNCKNLLLLQMSNSRV